MSGGKPQGFPAIAVVLALICATLAIIEVPAGAASTWSIASSPSPFRPDRLSLSGVSCADATHCFAVGNRSELSGYVDGIVIEQWNGTTWSKVVGPVAAAGRVSPSTVTGPAAAPSLSAVSCPTATTCFAVGSRAPGTLVERWDGASWNPIASPRLFGKQGRLNGVSCWSANGCIAVGAFTSDRKAQTLVERWDGVAWHLDASPNPAGAVSASLSAVSCPNETSCFAVGLHAEAGAYKGGALIEHWNGTAWKIQPSPTPKRHTPGLDGLLITPLLDGISCPTATSCTAVGYTPTDALIEHWNGTKWSLVASPHPAVHGAIAALRAVDCATATDCMTVGVTFRPLDYLNHVIIPNSIAEHWNGEAWTIVARPSKVPTNHAYVTGELGELSGVSCPAPNQCAAVGNSAMAERWDGAKWSLAPLAASTSDSALRGVACPSATTCFAVGSAFFLLGAAPNTLIERWDGMSWTVVPSPTITGTTVSATLASISCVTPTDCTAVGGYTTQAAYSPTVGPALIEHWDGAKWSRVPNPAPTKLPNIAYLQAVDCTSATDCNAVGEYQTNSESPSPIRHLFAEHWNGTTWTIVALPGAGRSFMSGISCASPTSCFAVGWTPTGATLVDQWDGARWTTVVSPTPESGIAYTLEAVSCPSASYCTAVGERYDGGQFGPLIAGWNGTTWSITPSPTPATIGLQMSGVSCASAISCTAVGTGPVIEHWDGNTWSLVAAAPLTTGTALNGITCTVEIGCTAVGARFGGIDPFTGPSYTLVERDM